MSGIQSNLKTLDLGAAFKALYESVKKESEIAKYKDEFIASGKSHWLAEQLAQEKYNSIQKQNNENV